MCSSDLMTVTGKTLAENLAETPDGDREVIRSFGQPLKPQAGCVVMGGNLFDSAVMKISVIDADFRARFLSHPDRPNVFEGRAVVFEGPEDYHERIEDPALDIQEQSVLVIRNCGPVGYPGSAEVVNMQPPAAAAVRRRGSLLHANGYSSLKKKTNAGVSRRSQKVVQLSSAMIETRLVPRLRASLNSVGTVCAASSMSASSSST